MNNGYGLEFWINPRSSEILKVRLLFPCFWIPNHEKNSASSRFGPRQEIYSLVEWSSRIDCCSCEGWSLRGLVPHSSCKDLQNTFEFSLAFSQDSLRMPEWCSEAFLSYCSFEKGDFSAPDRLGRLWRFPVHFLIGPSWISHIWTCNFNTTVLNLQPASNTIFRADVLIASVLHFLFLMVLFSASAFSSL